MTGSTIKGVVAILNCILARQLCFEDPSCSAILEIIPRVCGPIPDSALAATHPIPPQQQQQWK
ncbi:GD20067 [Drosophila simulans]|uniref:GD20067 n=1 Tax=Drosophila simulans TaxID=7240 RepID=B4QS36_DROSI|nr:GD20067 [Drosophila simulans]